jgi:hypothetical protein
MFTKAVEVAAQFTRPIHTIVRNFDSTLIQPSAATLFFVNSDGWALTCRHVAQLILGSDELAARRKAFIDDLNSMRGKQKENRLRHDLARKYNFSKSTAFEIYNIFMNCIEGDLNAELKGHPDFDVALIHFHNYKKLLCDSFPVFASNGSELKPGKYLCRLGFPFAEFTNFEYDNSSDQIRWTTEGRRDTPRFPIEGMVTRNVIDDKGTIIGFEMSTPGLRGQSGGPAFDADGRVWGMQSQTRHLDLDFDVNQEVLRDGQKRRITDHTFLHVGMCVHVEVLKSFMRDNGVKFQEG